MEIFRRKKVKAALNNQGSHQIYRQRSTHNLDLNSRSYDNNAAKGSSIACESKNITSRRVSALPVKNLLAQEMSKDTDAKRRSPSVVARLMGLEGLPSPQPIHRQQKASHQRTTSVGTEMRRDPYGYQSYRNGPDENPEFKDVYEVSEAKDCVKKNHSESEMSFIGQKFMDAKRLCADDKFHSSKEFLDTLNELDKNRDLLIKFLQQPDSLYTKHLHDLQGDFPMYVYNRERPISERCENETIDLKSKKGSSRSNTRYRREHLGSLSPNSFSPRSSNRSPESSEFRFQEKHQIEIRQIVVLKPSLEKQNAKKPVSSRKKHVEYPSDSVFSRPNMRESREIAKVISRRLSKNLGNEPMDFSSIFQGYAGDESSYSVSGSESGSELDETMLSSRRSFHWNKQRNDTTSDSHDSSMSREAKKRLSQRWKVSQRYRDVGSVGEVGRLGEMLGKPDREMRRNNFDPKLAPDISRDNYGSPSDLNFRDDRKERYISNVSKSGFDSDSSVGCYSPESSTYYRTRDQGGKLLPKEPTNRQRNKNTKENVYTKEDSPLRNQRSRNPEVQFLCENGDGTDAVQKYQCNLGIGKKITSAANSFDSKVPDSNGNGPCLMTEAELDVQHKGNALSCGSPDDLSVKPSLPSPGINNASAPGSKDSKQQGQVPKIQSPARSKEADQPSPISVLTGPLTEGTSLDSECLGSECFERVNSDLHGLRMQLKLLRMETEEDGGNCMLSDKDDSRRSFSDVEENAVFEHATWQNSYLDDILKESGFDSTDPNMIVAIWHSLECPIGPWVFDKLEKKYSQSNTISTSDRVLLFDRINCGLAEIFWWLVDPHPWVTTKRMKFDLGQAKKGTRYQLEKLFLSEENDSGEKALDQEMEWLEVRDEIDLIGQELQDLLVNELIEELINVRVL